MTPRHTSLNQIINKTYLTSALIPIFAIEFLLLLLYFGISHYMTEQSRQMLFEEARQRLIEISRREAAHIDAQFREVDRLLAMMRRDHEAFFASGSCFLPHGEPAFALHANGAYYKTADNGGGSTYYAATTPMTPETRRKARCSEQIDPLMQSIVTINPIVTQAYLNTDDDFNRLYPFMPDAPAQYGPALHMRDYNFFYLADPEHNPERRSLWTGAYLDPAGQGWMISNIAPIYRGETFEGVSGLDVTIDSLVRNILSLEIPWHGSAFLVDDAGMILAMPERVEQIFGLKELKSHVYRSNVTQTVEKPEAYNLLKSPDTHLRERMAVLISRDGGIETLRIGGIDYILAQQTIPQTQWKLMLLLDASAMLKPTRDLKALADRIGYAVLGLMLLFYVLFFLYLLRKSRKVAANISEPIEELSRLTTDLGSHPGHLLERRAGIAEVDRLIDNFNDLSTQLDARTRDYIEAQLREKMKEKDAEIAYRAGLFESASSYMHNIGNALSMLDAKIRMLGDTANALKKSGLGFEKLAGMVRRYEGTPEQAREIETFIASFNHALTADVTEELEELTREIASIKEHAVTSIRHQQDIFNADSRTKQHYVRHFDVKTLLASQLEEYRLSFIQKGIIVSFDAEDGLEVTTLKFQFQSGISNVLKNAIDAIAARGSAFQGEIGVKAFRRDDQVVVEISDNGIGVDPENRSGIFTSGYTTKADGHGLGLHAFNNYLNANGGTITLTSDGPDQGATVRITLGVSHAI